MSDIANWTSPKCPGQGWKRAWRGWDGVGVELLARLIFLEGRERLIRLEASTD